MSNKENDTSVVSVPALEAGLKEPFPPGDIQWRAGSTTKDKTRAMALAYLDARAIMERLDDVAGIENWQVKHTVEGDAFLCGIGIRIQGEWVWRWDGSGPTEFEPQKGGISGALKRAAAVWGIGRYLYKLDGVWVDYDAQKKRLATTPMLPDWALPEGMRGGSPQAVERERAIDDGPAPLEQTPEPLGFEVAQQPVKRGWSGEALNYCEQALSNAGIDVNRFSIIGSLARSTLEPTARKEDMLYWLKQYASKRGTEDVETSADFANHRYAEEKGK